MNVREKQLLLAYCGSRPKAKEGGFVSFFKNHLDMESGRVFGFLFAFCLFF